MEKLFAGRSVQKHVAEQHLRLRTAVGGVAWEEFEQRGAAGVVDALMARCAFTVPKLCPDRMLPPKVEERGSYGAEVTISLPFTGDATLFFVQPTDHEVRLEAELRRSELVFSYSSPTRDVARMRAEAERFVSEVAAALDELQRELDASTVPLRAEVAEAVERRRALLAAHPTVTQRRKPT